MASLKTPVGHGEVLTEPDYGQWARIARSTAESVRDLDVSIAGMALGDLRSMARRDAVIRAREFSVRMGVPLRPVQDEPDLLVMTGHQPEFYHPGIWVKDFLLQRLSEETGAAAIELIVDSDGFDSLDLHAPCLVPQPRICSSTLARARPGASYGSSPVPDAREIAHFCDQVVRAIDTLGIPAIRKHFDDFRSLLQEAAGSAEDLSELVTFARRRFEVSAGSDYLALPVTSMSRGEPFLAMVSHIALDAVEFASSHNRVLHEHRSRTGIRNTAQPVPDLTVRDGLVELPLWSLDGGVRRTVWARTGHMPALVVDGQVVVDLDEDAVGRLQASGLALAPKAILLTLYARLLLSDLFIHGVGGGRYDEITDGLVRDYLGIEPPRYAIASLTMYLPLGARVVPEDEVSQLSMALNRLRHNPDEALDDIEFIDPDERTRAFGLAREKETLVAAIGRPDADKKSLGARIRDVNAGLASVVAPQERRLRTELDELLRMRQAGEVLTDRTYPFCFWDPLEIADTVR